MTCPKCASKLQVGQDIELAQTLRCESCSVVVIVPHGDFQVQSYRLCKSDDYNEGQKCANGTPTN